MKIAVTITVDDTQKVIESVANLENNPNGQGPDPLTVQWMVLGMLADALRKINVEPAKAPPAQAAQPPRIVPPEAMQ
jgi:hypothetical protein